jgi:aminopeptidase N
MYPKGAVVFNMMRTIINDDDKWRNILRGLNSTFYHKTVTYDDIVNYVTTQSGTKLLPVFDQYMRYKGLPTLQVTWQAGKPYGKWLADAKGFEMPVKIKVKGGEYKFVTLTTTSQPIDLAGATKDNLEADTYDFYIKLSGIQKGS